ncbi:hypothetical protein BJ165DRAFT_1534892 [Panaeolus papilionaceus]|nr:hypothetical protein BJ165DRAFT_1534892 [Panaeolus papilionaceus]
MENSPQVSTVLDDCLANQSLCEPFDLQSKEDITGLLSTTQMLRAQHLDKRRDLVQQLKVTTDTLCQVEQRMADLDIQLGRLYYAIGASGFRIPALIHPPFVQYQTTLTISGEDGHPISIVLD